MLRIKTKCSEYKGEPLQFGRSFVCLKDLFVNSRDCNQNVKNIQPLCESTCQAYGDAIKAFVTDETICPKGKGQSFDKKRKKSAERAFRNCLKISQGLPFTSSAQCIAGIESDAYSCGFAGNGTAAASYCSLYPNKSCCRDLGKLPSFNSFTPFIQLAESDYNGGDVISETEEKANSTKKIQTTSTKSTTATSSSNSTIAIVGGITGALVFVTVGLVLYYQSQRVKGSVYQAEDGSIKEGEALVNEHGWKLKCIVKV